MKRHTSANRHNNNKNSPIRELIRIAKNNETLLKTNQKLLEKLISMTAVTVAKSNDKACMAELEVVVDTTTTTAAAAAAASNFTHMINDDPLYAFLVCFVTEEHSAVSSSSSSDIRLKKVMMAKEFYAQFKEFFDSHNAQKGKNATNSAVTKTIPAANTVSRRLIALQSPGISLGKTGGSSRYTFDLDLLKHTLEEKGIWQSWATMI